MVDGDEGFRMGAKTLGGDEVFDDDETVDNGELLGRGEVLGGDKVLGWRQSSWTTARTTVGGGALGRR